jgi:hypothetical protein
MGDVTSQNRSSLFRGEAFEYHFREQESRGVLNTSTSHPWRIVLGAMILACAALTYTLVAQVEVVYRAEGTMKLDERLAVAYVHGTPDMSVKPGARVRLELLRPISAGSQFIDGRLAALARAPTRLEIALDQPVGDPVNASGGASIPVRIHAVGCRQSLWRFALGTASGCREREGR